MFLIFFFNLFIDYLFVNKILFTQIFFELNFEFKSNIQLFVF